MFSIYYFVYRPIKVSLDIEPPLKPGDIITWRKEEWFCCHEYELVVRVKKYKSWWYGKQDAFLIKH